MSHHFSKIMIISTAVSGSPPDLLILLGGGGGGRARADPSPSSLLLSCSSESSSSCSAVSAFLVRRVHETLTTHMHIDAAWASTTPTTNSNPTSALISQDLQNMVWFTSSTVLIYLFPLFWSTYFHASTIFPTYSSARHPWWGLPSPRNTSGPEINGFFI